MLELEDLKTLRKYNSMPEEGQLKAVKENGWVICYLLNPSEQVQLAAVKQFGHYIEWIENPSEQVQIEAVRQNGRAIEHIKNPTEQVQIEAVKQNYNVIKYIENPSEKVMKLAVLKIVRDLRSVSTFLDLIKHSDKAYIQYLFDNLDLFNKDLFNKLDEDILNELKIGLNNLLISKEIDLSIINNNGNGSGPKP